MTDKEKARAYDEAIGKAQNILHTSEFIKITDLFPDLAESEDERIRTELLSSFKGIMADADEDELWYGLPYNDIIAYLERQKEEEGYEAIPVESTLEYKLGFKAGKESEKQKECLADSSKTSADDERIRKALIDALKTSKSVGELKFILPEPTRKDCIAYLEKQKINTEGDFGKGYDCGYQAGYAVAMNEMKPKVATVTLDSEKQKEQKVSVDDFKAKDWYVSKVDGKIHNIYYSVDKVKPKFKVGDKIIEKDFDECGRGTIIDIKDGKYIFDDGGFICIEEQGLWKLVEQKPAEVDESTKRLNDNWMRQHFDDCKERNTAMINGEPIPTENHSVDIPLAEWSEEDEDFINMLILHFNYLINKGGDSVETYKSYIKKLKSIQPQPKQEWSEDDKGVLLSIKCVIDEVWHSTPDINIGYTKEELKEMWQWLDGIWQRVEYPEDKVEWGEKDEETLNNILYILNQLKDTTVHKEDKTAEKCISWLKSLRPQPKQEWSEKEKKMLAVISYKISQHQGNDERSLFTPDEAEFIDGMEDKLKSLKPSWKPSEQEKGALRTAIYVLTEERNFPKTAAQLQNILNAFEGEEPRKDWKPSEEQMDVLNKMTLGNFFRLRPI